MHVCISTCGMCWLKIKYEYIGNVVRYGWVKGVLG